MKKSTHVYLAILYFFVVIFILVLLSSCVTQKKCNMKYPPQTSTIIKDSIRTEIKYRDTTIFVTLPVKFVTKIDTVYVKDGKILNKKLTAVSNYATAEAGIRQNKLYLNLMDKDTTLEIKLKNALEMASYYEMKFNTEQKVVYVEKDLKPCQKILIGTGIGSLLFLAGLILYKIYKIRI